MDDFNPCEELLPTIVDHYAAVYPDRIYAEYPNVTTTYEKGYRKITYRDLSNAVNGLAWFLTNTLGPGDGTETLPYVGPNDLRYPALAVGAMKAGYRIFYTSPRNSVAAHQSLLGELRCKSFLTPTPWPPAVSIIIESIDLRVTEVPSVDELLKTEYPMFHFEKTLAANALDICMVIHTSGSTGIPKPIFFTHNTVSTSMKMSRLDPPEGFDSLDRMTEGKRLFMTFPPFHGACLVCHLFYAIPFGTVIISPISTTIPSARGMVEAIKQTQVDGGFIIPSIVQELAQERELLEFCAQRMEFLIFCGGDLPQNIGDPVAAKIKLINLYGATELGLLPMVFSRTNRGPEDWKYVEIHPDMGIEFQHVADDQHEVVVVRHPDLEKHQPTFAYRNFSDLQVYGSRDLFVQHPDPKKKNLWKWQARKDDIIVFLNGEKTNPISMEQHILSRNPQVTGVLVVGAQRFQAALLIEIDTGGEEMSPSKRTALLEVVWPSIEEANEVCPAHARIFKTHVLFTRHDKPMLRAGKGTVQRSGTLKLYTREIDALYAEAESILQPNGSIGPGKSVDRRVVCDFIRSTVLAITQWTELEDTENMFIRGMDSLQAVTIFRILRHGLEMSAIDASLIYMKPCISEFTDTIMQLKKNTLPSAETGPANRLEERQKMLKLFQEKIDQIKKPLSQPAVPAESHHVILTGSTGSLGTFILRDLLANPSVGHVYCLNRRDGAHSKQLESNKTHHLGAEFDDARVTFLKVDLSKDRFDLPEETFQTLQDTTTAVIHNAWPVNFNMSLSSFEPQLSGVVNLISFCASAAAHPRLFFISSVSSVMTHISKSGVTPEHVVIHDSPTPNGYAESKYLAELLLDYAAKKLMIPLSLARVGQISGAVKAPGLWNPTEWFPSLVLSSLYIGAVPASLGPAMGRIDWVPVDLLANVIIQLALSQTSESGIGAVEVFHPINLHALSWTTFLPTVLEAIRAVTDKDLDVIPLEKWVALVRQDMEDKSRDNSGDNRDLQALLKANPAVKLLDFYEQLEAQDQGQTPKNEARICVPNVLDTTQTAEKSDALRAVPAIKRSWFIKWVSEWICED